MFGIRFINGYVLTEECKKEILAKVIEVLKNNLPAEAHTAEILESILDECKEKIRSTRVEL